jgi:hypothetical protein
MFGGCRLTAPFPNSWQMATIAKSNQHGTLIFEVSALMMIINF